MNLKGDRPSGARKKRYTNQRNKYMILVYYGEGGGGYKYECQAIVLHNF